MTKTSRQIKWQKKKKAEGKCIICGKPAINATYCGRHRDIYRESQKKRVDKKVADGKCLFCNEPVTAGSRHCRKHKRSVYDKAQALIQARKDIGLCISCNRLAVNANHCEYHRDLNRERGRIYREKKALPIKTVLETEC